MYRLTAVAARSASSGVRLLSSSRTALSKRPPKVAELVSEGVFIPPRLDHFFERQDNPHKLSYGTVRRRMLSPSKSRHSSQSSPSSPEGEFAEIGSNVTILPARQQNITQQQQLKRSENAARIERRLKNTVELVFSNEAMPSPALSLLNLQITRVVLAANFKRAAVYWRTAETLESASAKAKRMGVIVPNVGVGRADIAMALKKHEAVMQMLIERHANLKVCPKVRFVDDCDTAEGMNTIEMEHE